jgi:unsaturated rhamnogalacturonyl hydrolase
LLDLPPEDHLRKYLIDVLEAQINGLASLQAKDGRWYTLLDHPDSYLESSATAGFAFGILKAVRKRYISSKYLDTGVKAVKAIIANIDTSGELKGTSFGTPVFETLDLYKTIPIRSMPYGQAMAIMALVEFSYLFY